jgi:hypothetical protein
MRFPIDLVKRLRHLAALRHAWRGSPESQAAKAYRGVGVGLGIVKEKFLLGSGAGPAEEIALGEINTNRPEFLNGCLLFDKFCYALDLKPMRDVID